MSSRALATPRLFTRYLATRSSMPKPSRPEVSRVGASCCRTVYALVVCDQMARIAIVPSWVRFYDFGAGRMPKSLKEFAERNRS